MYRSVLALEPQPAVTFQVGAENVMLGLNWLLELTRTISAETNYEALLQNGIGLVGESLGVEKALFLSRDKGMWILRSRYLRGEGAMRQGPVLTASDSGELCMVFLDRVIRFKKKKVLDGASAKGFFEGTPYGKKHKPRFALGQPITTGGKLNHLIYLENRTEMCNYSVEKVEMMELIAAQLSIALENSRRAATWVGGEYGRPERRIWSEETRRKHRVAHEKMAALGALTAGVAHEINNPTNFTHSSAQQLEIELQEFKDFLFDLAEDGGEEIREAFNDEMAPLFRRVATIKEGTRRITGIIQDLRTFSRMEETVKRTAAIGESLRSTINLIKTNYKDKVNFICNFNDSLSIPCFISELNQVFMNILVNASQAIIQKQKEDGNTEKGEVVVATQREEDWAIVKISDTGCGMSEAVIGKIFDSYFTTKGAGTGTGLGLSLTREMVQRQGGRIDVSSRVGEGSTFSIYLPVS